MSSPAVAHPLVERLREEIDRRHLTKRETAEQLGIAERTIIYWLNSGATPQPRHRRTIIAWLEEDEAAA